MSRLRAWMSTRRYLYHGMMFLGETNCADAPFRAPQSSAYLGIVERVSRLDVAGALLADAWRKEMSIRS